MEHTQKKRHFSEEETLEKLESKIDHNMEKIMNKWFIHRFLEHKVIKNILSTHVVNDGNSRLQPYLNIIFTLVGWISLIAWIIGIFSFLISLSELGFVFTLGLGIGIRVLIYVLLALLFSLISLFMGFGMIRRKRRVIALVTLGLMVSIVIFIISSVPVGMYSYSSYGSFWSGLLNLLVTFVLFILVGKNEYMFKN